MTNCADTARRPDEQRLVDVVSILAAGILRLRERHSLPTGDTPSNPGDSFPQRLELSGETMLSVVHGGLPAARCSLDQRDQIKADRRLNRSKGSGVFVRKVENQEKNQEGHTKTFSNLLFAIKPSASTKRLACGFYWFRVQFQGRSRFCFVWPRLVFRRPWCEQKSGRACWLAI